MRKRLLYELLAAALLFALWPVHLKANAAESATLSLHNTTPATTVPLQGIGGEVNVDMMSHYGTGSGMTEGDFQLFKARTKKMETSFIRLWTLFHWFNPTDGTADYESPEMQAVYKYLDFYQSIGANVLLQQLSVGDRNDMYPWLWWTNDDAAGPGSDPVKLDKWATLLKDFLVYLHDTKGYTCIKYVSLWNEPNLSVGTAQLPPGYTSLQYTHLLYQTLKDKLADSGIAYIEVMGPDYTDVVDGWLNDYATLGADSVDSYSYHEYQWYGSYAAQAAHFDTVRSDVLSRDADAANKGFVLNEFGVVPSNPEMRDADFRQAVGAAHTVASVLNAGWTGVSRWTQFDSFFTEIANANQTGTNNQSGDSNWGLWRSKDFGWMPRQNYYSYSLLSKFIKPGSTIYKTASSNPNIQGALVKSPTGEYTVVAVNTSDTAAYDVAFSADAGINQTLHKFVVTQNQPVDRMGTLVQPTDSYTVASGWADTLPAFSVSVYTAAWHPEVAVGAASGAAVTDGKVPHLSWTAASNAWYYRVYRSRQQGFAPSPANQIGESDTNGYIDESIPDAKGTYYYQIVPVGKSEQTGSASSEVVLNHNYQFGAQLSYDGTTDAGNTYTITSDRADGYAFKIDKKAGVGRFFADAFGNRKYGQGDPWKSLPLIKKNDGTDLFKYTWYGSGMRENVVNTVSAPVVRPDGSIEVNVLSAKDGTSNLKYEFYPTYIRLSIAGRPAGYQNLDSSYLGMNKVLWADQSEQALDTLAGGGYVENAGTSAFVLEQSGNPYGVKYEFESGPKDVKIYKEVTGGEHYTSFALADGEAYWMSIVRLSQNVNLVANPGFEADGGFTQTPGGWTTGGTNPDADYAESGGHTGAYRLAHWSSAAYQVNTSQTLNGLADGTYTLKAWVQSSGGHNTSYMYAKNFGGAQLTVDTAGYGDWTRLAIRGIEVTNGQAEIGFYNDSTAGAWVRIDDIEFVPVNPIANPGFEADGGPTQHPAGWSTTGTAAADYTEAGGHTGGYRLAHWSSAAYQVNTSQTLYGLANGTYTLKAWVQSSGGHNLSYMYAKGYGGAQVTADTAGYANWTLVTIPNIEVTNGQAEIGFFNDSTANAWVHLDDVQLVAANLVENPGFEADRGFAQTPSGWSTNGSPPDADYAEAGGHNGSFRLTHWSAAAHEVETGQLITGLANGTYALKVWIRASGGISVQAGVKFYGGAPTTVTASGGGWTQYTIAGIPVTANQCYISLYSNGGAATWAQFDDVELIRTA